MTDLDRDAIRARAEAATPGPWRVDEEIDGVYAGRKTVIRAGDPLPRAGAGLRIVTVGQTRAHHKPAEANVEFIAHARTDIPALLARLAEVEAALVMVKDADSNTVAKSLGLARDLGTARLRCDDLAAEIDRLRQDVDLNKAGWAAEIERLDTVEAERDAGRPIVAAAKTWLADMRGLNLGSAAVDILGDDFVAVIDAHRALCGTCDGTRSLHCAAHIAGDGCSDDMEIKCPDCTSVPGDETGDATPAEELLTAIFAATSTDCRTVDGVTVGLADAIITMARVLVVRDLTAPGVREALADLRQDEDVAALLAPVPGPVDRDPAIDRLAAPANASWLTEAIDSAIAENRRHRMTVPTRFGEDHEDTVEDANSWSCSCGESGRTHPMRHITAVELRAALPLLTRGVLEEAAVKVEAMKPSSNRFWDAQDAARVYLCNDIVKMLRAARQVTG